MKLTYWIFALIGLLIWSCNRTSVQKPNIIVILVDDMGYSDIGCFGSEIPTPNLDQLASEGLKMTSFYNAARCCPTRASILTGLYPHQAGIGDMTSDWNLPGYRGSLNYSCATLGEVMKLNGYTTFMSGKWHVGSTPEKWPAKRGFDQSFAFIEGACDYFNLNPYWSENQVSTITYNDSVIQPHEDFYMTTEITKYATEFIEKGSDNEKPFFMYVAYTAPHWPLHALEEDIELFRGKYMIGWDSLRSLRYARMLEMGLISPQWELSERYIESDQTLVWRNDGNENVTPAWSELTMEEKEKFDLRMAVYAAMVYRMDKGIGEIVSKLKETGQDKNTLIMFLSDNGACHEPIYLWDLVHENSGETGTPESFDAYGYPWANASNTPFRYFKHWTYEGGTSTPFIAWCPTLVKGGIINSQPAHIIDVMATCVDLAGGFYPDSLHCEKINSMEGKSLVPLFKQEKWSGHEILCWEHEGNRAARKGDWKIVSRFENHAFTPWELYNLHDDRSETNNLAEKFPDKVEELETEYHIWAERVNVIPRDSLLKIIY